MAMTARESEGLVNTKKFPKVHSTVPLYSKYTYTGEQTFENV
jgi:hypothetical protein